MTKTKKLLLALIGCSLLLIGLFIGRAQREITLTLGMFTGSNWDVYNAESYKVIDDAIAKFEKAHPNVTIEYKSGILKQDYSAWLASDIADGEQPDVFMVLSEDFNRLSSLGALLPLDDLIGENEISTDIFYESALSSGSYQSTQYALPYEINPTMMCVNRDLLEREGIAVPEGNWTIEQFYQICAQVTKDTNGDGTIDQYGSYGFEWQDAVNGYGIRLFDDEGATSNLNRSDVREALSYIQKLKDLNGGYQVSSEDFDKGNVAFCPLTFAQYRTYQPYPYRVSKYSTFKWSCLAMPGTTDNQKTSQIATSLIAINSKTTQRQLAFEFLETLTIDQEIQQELFENSQGASALKSVMASDSTKALLDQDALNNYSLKQDVLDAIMENAVIEPKFKKYNNVIERCDYLITNALNENKIDDQLVDIEREIDNQLK
ncbi:ABC transporter substrate-binding protein [Trichococcus ilyis]|nr:extracellular solute-binding protein [Trichococcus ilyis]